LIAIVTHLEGEEIFGSCKRKSNFPHGLEGDSHKHNRVKFSHPRVDAQPNKLVCNQKGYPLVLIAIHTQFPLMGVLRSLKCRVEMDCGTYNVVHQCCMYNAKHHKAIMHCKDNFQDHYSQYSYTHLLCFSVIVSKCIAQAS
jgi:hypothetical protein